MSNWIDDIIAPETRQWEEFYRNRFQHDKIVRSTHGVNCTGSCSWNVCVKDGIVTWELQAVDYPYFNHELPPYEPRGCQRGISFSWYLYSPIRVKYPYVRGSLLDTWNAAKKKNSDPVEAWASIQNDAELRTKYQKCRGKGGFRRASWNQVLEIMGAANIYTAKVHGPDRVTGFSPIPAMSQVSYAAGARFLQLFGGVCLSFYDWYCDLPPASPEIWGEQTDVGESADWYNSKMIAIMGANLNMTRTPDCHFIPEAKMNGTKVVTFSPDFNQVAKFGDEWVPIHQGQDGAFWMAVSHVVLNEFHVKEPTPYFLEYQKEFTDGPFLVEVKEKNGVYLPDRMLRASQTSEYGDEENGDWKYLMFDEKESKLKLPMGTMGHRWQTKKGQWNLLLKDGKDGSEIKPLLSFKESNDQVINIEFEEFGTKAKFSRGCPVKKIQTNDGEKFYTTIYDLMMGQHGVDRGLGGDYPTSYDDAAQSYTPAWQERFTGIDKEIVINFARDWAKTATATEGKCSVIIGAGINHWYHNNLIYRAAINALIFCGCVGKNGGGLNHYVGQEKLAPAAPWGTIAFAKDWQGPVRLQNAPSWHYMHSDQWRYDSNYEHINAAPEGNALAKGHTADLNAQAVRSGWLPFFPQWKQNTLDICKSAQDGGAGSDDDIKAKVLEQIKSGALEPAIEDIDAPESFPRVWYIWRGNAIGTSSKGHEYFLDHYLGTHTNQISDDAHAKDEVKEIKWHEKAPTGKMDLVVDLNFRMDTSALYSDIVLPAASWYEKNDLNTTDMHTYVHPLSAAIPPVWEAKPDWIIFKELARVTSEIAKTHLPNPVKDIHTLPLMHDTPDEITQLDIKDWKKGECEAIPGKTMFKLVVTERDYTKIYDKFCSFGPKANGSIGAHGVSYDISDYYEKMKETHPTYEFDGEVYPALTEGLEAANTILHLASETNGELAYRAFVGQEEKTGVPLKDLAEKNRNINFQFRDIQAQPKRLITSPIWSGIIEDGAAYSAFCMSVARKVPWRTITGRQHLYLEHEGYIQFGEHLPTYKPSPTPEAYGDLRKTESVGKSIRLNYLTPHGKWHIHSTYGDTNRMLTLSRGTEPFWISPEDAKEIGVEDNDYVEIYNDNGVIVTRANVSYRIPPGMCIVYHATERTYHVPKSPLRGNKRAGMNNSVTRVHLKPNLMVGGYGQFTYHFNYWGPTGVNRDTHILVRKLDKVSW